LGKSADAFRTISEVAAQLETPAHVLRFWESKFPQIRPVKRAGGRRYYRPDDIALLGGIKVLLHEQGMTIRGVQKLLKEQGVRHVATQSALPWEGVDLEETAAGDANSILGAVDLERGSNGLVDPFVAFAPRPPAESTSMPRLRVESPAPTVGHLAALRQALSAANPEQLRKRASHLAPLVRRLEMLRSQSS
jgi:DNA-binding transcriptional MerR regulator